MEIIVIGLKIYNFTIIKRVEDFDGKSESRPQWLVRCDCGRESKKVNRYILRSTGNCGKGCGLRKTTQNNKQIPASRDRAVNV